MDNPAERLIRERQSEFESRQAQFLLVTFLILHTDILEKNDIFVEQYNNEINVTNDEYSKKKITEKYNNDWNNKLIRELQINPINITNDNYTKLYDCNGIVLIPSHAQYINNIKKTVYLSKYSGMKQTNWNLISLLPNHTNQKLCNEAEYDGEYDPSLNKEIEKFFIK